MEAYVPCDCIARNPASSMALRSRYCVNPQLLGDFTVGAASTGV